MAMVEPSQLSTFLIDDAMPIPEERFFPLLRDGRDIDRVPVEWAKEAYKEYARQYGTSQSLQRLGERGGFGVDEIIRLLYARCQRLSKELSDPLYNGPR